MADKLNILLFTADDLGCDSLGCFGSNAPDISPTWMRLLQRVCGSVMGM